MVTKTQLKLAYANGNFLAGVTECPRRRNLMGFRDGLIQGFPLCPSNQLLPPILYSCFHGIGFILRSHMVAKCSGLTLSRKE